MAIAAVLSKAFEPGTTGWTVADLDDAAIEGQWYAGRYEIIEGVLTTMAPAYYDGSIPLQRLIRQITRHLDANGLGGEFATEPDHVLTPKRVAKPDAVFITTEFLAKQKAATRGKLLGRVRIGRGLVPPPLVIESLSPGHEAHDRETKRQWYAEYRVPNYWLLDAYGRSLECLILDGEQYRVDCAGLGREELQPSFFPGLVIALTSLWVE